MPNINENEVIGFFKNFLKEDQDFVKMQLIDSILALEQAYANNTQVASSTAARYENSLCDLEIKFSRRSVYQNDC